LMSCPCHSMCAPIFFSIASKQLVCYVCVWWHMANARLPAGKPFYPYTKVLISTKSLSAAAACVVRRACTDIRGTTTRVLCCVLLLHLNGACGGWGAYYQSSFQQHRHQKPRQSLAVQAQTSKPCRTYRTLPTMRLRSI
jgi:hypothetical protein